MGTSVVRSARHRRPSWFVALVASMTLGLLLAGPALAADPPADVVLDGVVTIRFVDGVDGSPLAGAAVTIEASRPEIDIEPFQTRSGETAADGSVAIDGVARAADGAAPVTLAISASLARDNDCGGVETIDAATTVEAAESVAIDLVGDASSSCAAFPVFGMVLDANDEPFAVDDAAATITYPATDPETVDVEVASDGSFAIILRAWSGEGSTDVHLTVLGTPREAESANGCTDTVAEVADLSWTLDEPVAPEPMIVTADAVVLGSVCTGTGTPGAPAPRVTLPPTDVIAAAGPSAGDEAGAPAALGSLAMVGLVALLAALVGPRRISRRGS